MSPSGDKVCVCVRVCVCVWGKARERERENLTLESFASLISERTWFIKWCERAVWAKHGSHTERLSLCFFSINLVFFCGWKKKMRSVPDTPVSADLCREGCHGSCASNKLIGWFRSLLEGGFKAEKLHLFVWIQVFKSKGNFLVRKLKL